MEKTVQQYLDMMGYAHKDRITNFEGTAIAVSFDIAGCVQVTLAPQIKKAGELESSVVIDAKRLTKVGRSHAMTPRSIAPEAGLDFLGRTCKDRITGFTGTVTSIGFSITGNAEAIVAPPIKKDKELATSAWFELERLEKVGTTRAMPKPDFILVDGPETRPARQAARRI